MTPPSREFELAVACCRWPPGEARKADVVRKAAHVDWPDFETVVQRHRIGALAWHALRESGIALPQGTSARLHQTASQVAAQNLLIAAECFRLQQAFAGAGIPLLFLKGLTLAVLAYGTPSLKMGSDVDILVPPGAVGLAARLMAELNYRLSIPDARIPPDALPRWHEAWKESVWESPGAVIVELHSALVDNPGLLEGVGMDSPRQEVEIAPGRSLPTFADAELFAYLCVHGASSAWFRLKWIADFAAFNSGRSREELTSLYDRSQQLGAGRSAAQALLLAEHLFDLDLDPELAKRLKADRLNRWLVRSALALMSGRGATKELHELRFGTLPIHLTQYVLRRGWAFKKSQLRRQLTDPYSAAAGHGPARKLASRLGALARAGRLIR